jgi:Ca2+-binding RTX toxin-like protein
VTIGGSLLNIGDDSFRTNACVWLGGNASGGNHSVKVSASGSAVTYSNFAPAVGLSGNNNKFVNHGTVSGAGCVRNEGDNFHLINTGNLRHGTQNTDFFDYIVDAGYQQDQVVFNSGQIDGRNGLRLGYDSQFKNSGTVIAQKSAIVFSNYTHQTDAAEAAENKVINTGFISANDYAISSFVASNTLKNGGIITGDIQFGSNLDKIVNTGLITGRIWLGEGDDSLVSSGTITGIVSLGGGDDVMVLTGTATLAGSANGGTGNDRMTGSGGIDWFFGEDGNDRLQGGAGDDRLDGGKDDDKLLGDAGEDLLIGGSGNDHLEGGTGNDQLRGGRGQDVLLGGDGDDILFGGYDRDWLTGGDGADLFRFTNLRDSGTGKGQSDVIRDFEQGTDKIDVSLLPTSAPTGYHYGFSGTSAFSGSGSAEIRYFTNKSGNTIVQLDGNGDGAADAQITLLGTMALTESDFVLFL